MIGTRFARFIGRDAAGKRVYRVPVRVCFNDSRLCATVAEEQFEVVAHSAAEAANWARDQVATRAETEVYAYGPKGARVHRYVGWTSAIGAQIAEECFSARVAAAQPPLFI